MKNSIDAQLQKIADEKRIGLMTHVVVGYPTLGTTLDLIRTMASNGADMIELQIPFSDPIADGPTIQQACETSLAGGTKVTDAFAVARQVSSEIQVPLLFMAYFNTVYKYGTEKFCADAKASGISGLIVPDAPLEAAEHEGFLQACKRHNLHYIITLSPASNTDRIKKNVKVAGGFAYCMTRSGITGARQTLEPQTALYLRNIQKYIKIPLAAGFGISKREHLDMLKPYVRVAIVGSALIDIIAASDHPNVLRNVRTFLRQLVPDQNTEY